MIETEILILRPWEETDAEAMFRYASDQDISPFAAPETYAVVLKAMGGPVGNCGIMLSEGFRSAEMKQHKAEIGY